IFSEATSWTWAETRRLPLTVEYSQARSRLAPAARAASRSAEIPGTAKGRAPRDAPMARSVPVATTWLLGTVSCVVRMSAKARPIQSIEVSPERFSQRSTARRAACWGGFGLLHAAQIASIESRHRTPTNLEYPQQTAC